jgi:hypothetical protein
VTGEPRRLRDGLPSGPLLRAYAMATAAPSPVLAPGRRSARPLAVMSGLAAVFLGAWLVARAPAGAPVGSSGSEGASGTGLGTGGVSG